MSSPRSWGCFWIQWTMDRWKGVFPTLVGVFLERGTISSTYPGLPHARGGVSSSSVEKQLRIFVFPTLVGVFPVPGAFFRGWA